MCSLIVLDAIKLRASDIHIEPGPPEMRVRLRIDGVLRDHLQLPRWMHAALVSRIKILAKLDIAQQRLPQDGRMKVRGGDRASICACRRCPRISARRWSCGCSARRGRRALTALGLSARRDGAARGRAEPAAGTDPGDRPDGRGQEHDAVLDAHDAATPPRSTSSRSRIRSSIRWRAPTRCRWTAKAGLTFASCLRAILRQDPDVILVGEIRDLETAEIAFQAALTGHLVFSTLHTNGSLAAIERLLDLGVKPLLVTSATNLIIAQRLARRICMNCREPYFPSADRAAQAAHPADGHKFQHGKGCALCGQTGYAGRVGIFEILRLTPRLKELVSRHATEPEMTAAAVAAGTQLLMTDALSKVRQGLTTVEEILRMIRIEPSQTCGQDNLLTR